MVAKTDWTLAILPGLIPSMWKPSNKEPGSKECPFSLFFDFFDSLKNGLHEKQMK